MCSARVTPDQPGERVGATTKNQVESSLSDTCVVFVISFGLGWKITAPVAETVSAV